MTRPQGPKGRHHERGQTIVLVALMMVIFVGITGLVVDIGGAYSEQRFDRSIADSASLAGAQQLQTSNRRTSPGAAEYASARELSMRSVVNQLANSAAPLPPCPGVGGPPYAADVVNCQLPGTSYYVSISAPAMTCVNLGGCDPLRSVQVSVRRPDFGLVFAKIFNQLEWNVVATSISELGWSPNYALVTLRPPDPRDPCPPNCDDNNEDNILLDGTTTTLTVSGDIGTNTNLTLKAGATVVMDPAHSVYHYDTYVNGWSPPLSAKQLSSPIADPDYAYPTRTGAPSPYTTEAMARLSTSDCEIERLRVPAAYGIGTLSALTGDVVCYKKGIYQIKPNPGSHASAILLTPGVYFFDKGLDVGSDVKLIGGYTPASEGVALVFPDKCTPPCQFFAQSAPGHEPLVALNAGTAYPVITSGATATAAIGFDSQPVETNTDPPILMTIMVQHDILGRCIIAEVEPPNCPSNTQLKLPGGGSLYLTGVQYAPNDNSEIKGGSSGSGYIGQFISWTVKYTGGSQITFTSAGDEGPGILRIATPCSPGTACSADYTDDRVP
jgi:hypothetical protein